MEARTRMCGRCQQVKNVSEFGANRAKRDGLQTQCRECKREFQNRWYAENKVRHIKNVGEWKKVRGEQMIIRLVAYLQSHPCVDCGEADPQVLQFDHVRGQKTRAVGQMVTMGLAWATVAAEIEKCDVRCANCHLRRTARQFGHSRYALLTRLSLEK